MIKYNILCLTMLAGTTSFAREETAVTDENINPYVQELTEEVEIDGTTYSYEYDLQDGKKVTNITNEDTSETDVLVYDEEKGIFYLNGSVVAEIEDVEGDTITAEEQSGADVFEDGGVSMQSATSRYKYIGAVNKKVTWKHGVAVAVAAGIIAAALVCMTGAKIIFSHRKKCSQGFCK